MVFLFFFDFLICVAQKFFPISKCDYHNFLFYEGLYTFHVLSALSFMLVRSAEQWNEAELQEIGFGTVRNPLESVNAVVDGLCVEIATVK